MFTFWPWYRLSRSDPTMVSCETLRPQRQLTNGGRTPLNCGGKGGGGVCWPTWAGSCGGTAKGPELLPLCCPSGAEDAGLDPPCIHEPSVWGLRLGPGPYCISVVLPAVACVPVVVVPPSPEDKLQARGSRLPPENFPTRPTWGIRAGTGGSDTAEGAAGLRVRSSPSSRTWRRLLRQPSQCVSGERCWSRAERSRPDAASTAAVGHRHRSGCSRLSSPLLLLSSMLLPGGIRRMTTSY